jgi:hypothetical protein
MKPAPSRCENESSSGLLHLIVTQDRDKRFTFGARALELNYCTSHGLAIPDLAYPKKMVHNRPHALCTNPIGFSNGHRAEEKEVHQIRRRLALLAPRSKDCKDDARSTRQWALRLVCLHERSRLPTSSLNP